MSDSQSDPVCHPDAAEQRAIVDGLVRMVSSETGGPLLMLDQLTALPTAVGMQLGKFLLLLADQVVSDRATWMHMLDDESDRLRVRDEMFRNAHSCQRPSVAEMQVIEAREVRLNAIADAHNLISIWSVGNADNLDTPHPYQGATTIVHETLSGDTDRGRVWGGDGGRFTASINGPRWLDLWRAADAAIQASGDLHHRFIEYFTAGDDPTELHLATGS